MITEGEKKVYSELFHIVKVNMEAAGQEMIPLEEAFLTTVGIAPDTADVLQLRRLNKKGLVQASFASILRRFPDEGAIADWAKKEDMPCEEYRIKLITTLVNSAEYKQKGIRVCNNIYSSAQKQPVQVVVQTGYAGMDRLVKIYSRMPKWMKKLAKKILK